MRPRWGSIHRVHFMGIGGVGMCALAEVLLDDGILVSGCDAAESERTQHLADRGADIMMGHNPGHPAAADAFVVTAAVPQDHPELQAARELGIPIVRRADLVAEAVRGLTGVAIAGTHGKTTTAALLTHLLTAIGASPTAIVGGRPVGSRNYGKRGCGQAAVCEADEFDRAFLQLDPTIAVVTNVESDHLDCYGSEEGLHSAFAAFAGLPPFHGVLIVCADDAGAASLTSAARARVLSYGLSRQADLRAVNLEAGAAGTHFTVERKGLRLGEVRLPLAGEHNVNNALAALAAGCELGHDFHDLARACADFPGVGRRFEILGSRREITVVDDYAHHPTEIAATLQSAAQTFAGRRLVVVFQPHLYSRTRDLCDDFGRVLSRADRLVVLPIFAARESPPAGVSHHLVMQAARDNGVPSVVECRSIEEAPALLDPLLEAGDVLLTVGAGDVDRVGRLWLGEDA